MAKSTSVKIPLIAWRDGRPRFSPGPGLRKMGFAGEDLRHPNGEWFTFEQANAWSQTRQAEIADHRATLNNGLRSNRALTAAQARARMSGLVTVSQMVSEWLRTPRLRGETVVEGRKERAALAPSTVKYYIAASRILEHPDMGSFWHQPASAITARHLDGLLHRVEVKHGLQRTRAVRAMLSVAWGWGRKEYNLPRNPVADLQTTLPVPAPRVRYGTVEEMQVLIDVTNRIGRADVALIIMLGLWTGQRQGDRLALTGGQMMDGAILFRQGKKKFQPLLIPPAPELSVAIKDAMARRYEWRVNYPEICLDERHRRPFKASWYTQIFDLVRFIAAHGRAPSAGQGDSAKTVKTGRAILRDVDVEKALEGFKPIASLANFRDQDLRDTAVTWLALAGCDEREIASITGHELTSINQILKHYFGLHPDLASRAIGKVSAWYQAEIDKRT